MRSSRAAVDLIVRFEVSSKETYIRQYQRPEWPGVASGITVGIGYDLGYNTARDIAQDWTPYLAPNVVAAMQRYAGLTRGAAQAKLHEARQSIVVPWDAAMAVFMQVTMPKFEAMVLKACPGSEKLPAGCFGVLTSITYNRGAGGFTSLGERYTEMHNIRSHILAGRWDKVEAEIRHMKRLWPTVDGLLRRRDEEANLYRDSLRAAPLPIVDEPSHTRDDTGDEKDLSIDPASEVTLPGNSSNVQPDNTEYSLETELLQRQLIDMKYFEVGEPDGKAGGKFVAGVCAFMTDRGKDPNKGRITPELKAEIARAKADRLPDGSPWSRPISPARANATAKDIQDKVPAVKDHWWQKLWAYIIGTPAAAMALFKDWFGDYNDPSSVIYSVKNFFMAIPSELYLLAIVGIAGAIFWKAKKAQDATVEAYRQGKIN